MLKLQDIKEKYLGSDQVSFFTEISWDCLSNTNFRNDKTVKKTLDVNKI